MIGFFAFSFDCDLNDEFLLEHPQVYSDGPLGKVFNIKVYSSYLILALLSALVNFGIFSKVNNMINKFSQFKE